MNRFLIIEDNKMMANILAQLLRKSTNINKLYYAPGVKQAYALLLRKKIDCVFLDLNLESPLDGMEILDFIQKQHPDLSVVVVTGDSEIATVKRVISYNPNGYIVKPLSLSKVINALMKANNVSIDANVIP
ncbi:response regulator [Photobacterium nomapromontoriensis]|uniref:response regulator n=1 Tax=Photobacterium nomapromontoriensis TaxID=2910237 RepID=UPI003D1253E4